MRIMMTKLTIMKTTLQEESYIPSYAVQAFQQAFDQAQGSSKEVVYVEQKKLLKKMPSGEVIVLKDLTQAYRSPTLKHAVLKRSKKSASLV